MRMWGTKAAPITGAALIFLVVGLSGCSPAVISKAVSSGSCSNRVSPAYAGPSEGAYCSTTQTHANPVTVSGSASYDARTYTTSSGLSVAFTNRPIRYAEVVAMNGSGQVVQCGETDASGNFSLQLPTDSASYTIRISSRGDNSQVKASVLNCPEENIPYSISTTVVPDASKSVGAIRADATNSGDLMGAAFNIFDQIVAANEFLRAQASNCSSYFAGCTNFSVAPKVFAYWEKGFNPNAYFNSSSGLSFYLPGYHRLFILGGVNNDILSSDTDHFDNSIVLHEYGHFLEDVMTDTDSPGGSHSGNAVIDPRLAWGEAWGNFIQGAIRGEPRYRDTIGTPNPTTGSSYIFNIPLETPNGTCGIGSLTPGCDIPEFPSEGNFREFSVTRLLWDVFDSGGVDTDSDGINNAFRELWASLTSTSYGFLHPDARFRSVGLLHFIQQNKLTGQSDWSSLRTTHSHGDHAEYARHVLRTGSCGKIFTIDPYDDPNDNGTFVTSHLLRNNDFFYYKHSGGAFSLSLRAQTVDSSGGYITELEPDLDLYLYNTSARYGNSADIVASSENYWDNNPSTEQVESLSVSSLAAGTYLINVKIYTGRYLYDNNTSTNYCVGSGFRQICENDPAPDYNYIPAGDDANYELILNGANLCNANPF